MHAHSVGGQMFVYDSEVIQIQLLLLMMDTTVLVALFCVLLCLYLM